jgi:hypothetical protein
VSFGLAIGLERGLERELELDARKRLLSKYLQVVGAIGFEPMTSRVKL